MPKYQEGEAHFAASNTNIAMKGNTALDCNRRRPFLEFLNSIGINLIFGMFTIRLLSTGNRLQKLLY